MESGSETSVIDTVETSGSVGSHQMRTRAIELGKKLSRIDELATSSIKVRYPAIGYPLDQIVSEIVEGHHAAVQWARMGEDVSPIVDWMLDNYYILSERIDEIRVDLPPWFLKELPRVQGVPRMQVLASELLLLSDCSLDDQLIIEFARAFQETCDVRIGELWALSTWLKLCLLERLGFIANALVEDYAALLRASEFLSKVASQPYATYSHLSLLDSNAAILRAHRKLLADHDPQDSVVMSVEDHAESTGRTIAELQKLEQRRLATMQVTIGNIITSLRFLASIDWADLFENTSKVESLLRQDSLYPQMDFASRNAYRSAVEELAKGSQCTEQETARLAIELARNSPLSTLRNHVGFWLVDDGRKDLEARIGFRPKLRRRLVEIVQQHPYATYFGGWLAICIALLASNAYFISQSGWEGWIVWLWVAASAIPHSEMAIAIWNAILTRMLPVSQLPKIDFTDGVDARNPTWVVVPSMLTSAKEVHHLLAQLENHFLANRDPQFSFALLTDFPDADEEHSDKDVELVQLAKQGIRKLNQRYSVRDGVSVFYLFHRMRRWNPSEQRWMGWERKRGKLLEFSKWVQCGSTSSTIIVEGDLSRLDRYRHPENTPWIITLDSDTLLPRDAAQRLVGVASHPLNRVEIDALTHQVNRGYTIFQPRVSLHTGEQKQTRYLQLHTANAGLDPYVSAASDVYQDLFREGSFTGKGIFDLRRFEFLLDELFPENRILSHDLIEGCHARVALVSDIEVYDGYPGRYDADMRRHHRWTRGDWQIGSWLFPTVPTAKGYVNNRLSALSKWKIFDNLRRSLVAPSTFLLLFLGFWLGGVAGTLGAMTGTLLSAIPFLIQLSVGWTGGPRLASWMQRLRKHAIDSIRSIELALYHFAFLPHRCVLMVDAILRTLYRIVISKKRLLEWETAAAVEERLKREKGAVLRQLMGCSVAGVGMFLLFDDKIAWVLGAIWLFAPLWGHAISMPLATQEKSLEEDQELYLLQCASATWGYFEAFVEERNHWLPPDNVQEYPLLKIATRISPTNEGMFLVSTLVARELGFLGIDSMIHLLERNLASWLSLPTFQGHHYNWYETRTLEPLAPRYVSTVDSGNLLASYLTVAAGLVEQIDRPLFGPHVVRSVKASIHWLVRRMRRIKIDAKNIPTDVVAQIDEYIEYLETCQWMMDTLTDGSSAWKQFVERIDVLAARLTQMELQLKDSSRLTAISDIARWARIIANRLEDTSRETRSLVPWLFSEKYEALLGISPSESQDTTPLTQSMRSGCTLNDIFRLPRILDEARCENSLEYHAIAESAREAAALAQDRMERIYLLKKQCEDAADAMSFGFLLNERRNLFSIGYNIELGKLDKNCYDLLCSECRLASYLAIARGDVDAEHWFRLGRQATLIQGVPTLLSWGGTMFEYLMPNLFMRSLPGSLLDSTCRSAVARQMEYGAELGIPWGVSESAYASIATNSDYQYRSFGVPKLGLKRGLAKDQVISPYSTFLALSATKDKAIANLVRMEDMGLGTWGFYDAIDFTRSRLRKGEQYRTVRNYMAHHHGMTLLSLCNALRDQLIPKWFHANPMVRANQLLLEEKSLHFAASKLPDDADEDPTAIRAKERVVLSRIVRGIEHNSPKIHLLSNSHFTSCINHVGGGFCQAEGVQLNRWRADACTENFGVFVYLRDPQTEEVWSPTLLPTKCIPDKYEVIYSADKAEFHRKQGTIETRLELVVSPEHAAEVRQLRITNTGPHPRTLEVSTYQEVILAPRKADAAHPAFQKLFIETEYVPEDATLIARRRPRDKTHLPMYALHTLAVPADVASSIQWETSREEFLGRLGDVEDPEALYRLQWNQKTGAVLDTIFALRCTVNIPPGECVVIGMTSAMAESEEEAKRLGDLYHDLRGVQRAFELAWAFAQVEMQQDTFEPRKIHLFHQLAGYLLYPVLLEHPSQAATKNRWSQSMLWRFGISGDFPIVLCHIQNASDIDVFRDLLESQEYLMKRGLSWDLVMLNEFPGSYFDTLQEELQSILANTEQQATKHVFVLRRASLSEADASLLSSVAALEWEAQHGRLETQLRRMDPRVQSTAMSLHPSCIRRRNGIVATPGEKVQEDSHAISSFNGFGGFVDGGGYRIDNATQKLLPAPWSNILANESFGTLITEVGGGYTWFQNSRENKLTSWSNDPILDTPSEVLYLTEATGVWSPLQPIGDFQSERVVHGMGVSTYYRVRDELESELRVFVDPELPLKYYFLKLSNASNKERCVDLTVYAETVLGVQREDTWLHQYSYWDESNHCLVMKNGYHADFPDQEFYLASIGEHIVEWSGDRASFLGRYGSWKDPVGLRAALNGSVGARLDPCAVVRLTLDIPPKETREVCVILGAADHQGDRQKDLLAIDSMDKIRERLERCELEWNDRCRSVRISTPNAAMDRLMNGWLLYQTIVCRFFARSAFYQSGGAFGFRDQLQDVMALVYSCPSMARQHLLHAASRQYIEGDVQHWWHLPSGRGTRTRFSDDFLFLPFVVGHYLRVTGDRGILQEMVPFLVSVPLTEEEHERYEQPSQSSESASLLEHCLRALQHGMRYGEHGLPLMGCGDWNDGMSRVGVGGRGESVWVAWFQIVVFREFASILREEGGHDAWCQLLESSAEHLQGSIEKVAWDGHWYRRAFFDDGTPLGSHQNLECQIDSLSQSWAVLANGPTARSTEAFQAALDRLYYPQEKMMLLFHPPFVDSAQDPGYIQGYVAGVRENGGQYTHAAIWMIQAATRLGRGELAMELFDALNPIHHTSSEQEVMRYRLEPYVIAADVYSNPDHFGRGGWSWYTGSSAWLYRVGLESILGFEKRGPVVRFRPQVPLSWNEFTVEIRNGGSLWKIRVTLVDRTIDASTSDSIELYDDGASHEVEIVIARQSHN